ncbi:MAG TPA: thiol:disulfide interchange protein DsbA/DsbL [Gammaproteobacteria bacterium]|nr:thiol:disulfide interchange protein DsbA/DsbL [Gammaproteobacteria bacterium]
MMNCETIDSLLDDHLVARLSPAERKRAADHVSGCARCSAAWAVDEALRGEAIADPAPELFATVLRRTSAMPTQSGTTRRRRFVSLAAAAAAVAIVAVAARWAVIEPEGAAPPEVSSIPSTVAASRFVAGRDYDVLTGAAARVGAPAPAGTVEVVEFFMFECFPCFSFEADLNRWEAGARGSVSLIRVPAMFNPAARLHARAFYTAEALGKLDTMRSELYDEIHLRENPLDSRDLVADFFGRFGVDRATFDATFDSSEVDARFQHAIALNREYGVQATPTMVVAGRYATDPSRAGSQILEVVDQLVADERRCQTRCDGLRPAQTGENPFGSEQPR